MTREKFDDIIYEYIGGMPSNIKYYVDLLEQQNTELQVRIKQLEDVNKNYGDTIVELRSKVKELEEPKMCNGCEYEEYNYAHKCETCDRTIRNDYFTPKDTK